jgi:predicted RND superfamily exporter protein
VNKNNNDYVDRLSHFFASLGTWSFDHRWIVLTLSLASLALFFSWASTVRVDNSFENYFSPDDPAYMAYLDYREEFGSDEVSYIVYEVPDSPHGAWDLGAMRKIAHLTEALEDEVPFVKEVTSLANAEFLEPSPDGLEVIELLEEFPESQQAQLDIRGKVLAKPLYVGGLTSEDGRYGAVIIEMLKSSVDPLEEIKLDPEGGTALHNLYPQVTYDKIEEILARPAYAGIEFHHTGDVPLNATLNILIEEEGAALGGFTFALIAFTLFLFFRHPIGVVGPMAVVTLSLAISVGVIGLLGWHLDIMFGMLPNLLIAVGVADAVHIVSEFRIFHAETGDRREAIGRTLHLVGPPCLLTSLTTAAGLAAMTVAPIATLSRFAIYSSIGVLAAFFLSITLLVFFLSLGRAKTEPSPQAQSSGAQRFEGLLSSIASFDIRNRRSILTTFTVVFLISILGVFQMTVDSNFLTDFSDSVPVRGHTEFADEVMSGTNSYVFLFETEKEGGIQEPAVLREIERTQAHADLQTDVVNKTYSIVDLLKDINQTFHDGDPAYYRIPDTRELVAQYLLVYELSGGDDLENYLSGDYSSAALELRCKWTDSSLILAMSDSMTDYIDEAPLEASMLRRTGIGQLWEQLLGFITVSQIRSFSAAFVAIAALLCVMFGSIKIGMIAMVPNLSPVLLGLGAMGWLGVPLNYTTLLIAPVALGIAVDDTMHMVTRYRHEFQRCGNYAEALESSMKGVGRALVITSVVLVVGFLALLGSSLTSQADTGILLASTIVVALLADFLLMPALILTLEPFGPESQAAGRQ